MTQFFHDYGPIIATIITAIMGSGWFITWLSKQSALVQAVAHTAASFAVAKQMPMVNADKSNPNTGRGVGTVSAIVAKQAKKNAVQDVIGAISTAVSKANPAVGTIMAQMAPVVGDIVEQAVQAAKKAQNPDAPASVAALFPDGDEKI